MSTQMQIYSVTVWLLFDVYERNPKTVIWPPWPNSPPTGAGQQSPPAPLSLRCLPGQPCDTSSVDRQKACSIFNAFSPHNMQDISNGASQKHQSWLIKKFWLLIFSMNNKYVWVSICGSVKCNMCGLPRWSFSQLLLTLWLTLVPFKDG